MKKHLVCIAAAVFGMTAVYADDNGTCEAPNEGMLNMRGNRRGGQGGKGGMRRFGNLNLSEEQQASMQELMSSHRENMQMEMEELRSSVQEELSTVLDSEQLAAFEQLQGGGGRGQGRMKFGRRGGQGGGQGGNMESLNLSDDQKVKVQEVMQAMREIMEESREQTKSNFDQQVQSILTEEQFTAYKEMKQQRKGMKGQRGQRGMGNGERGQRRFNRPVEGESTIGI